jgi:uncharacterized protein YjbI with pentapeptide repeats
VSLKLRGDLLKGANLRGAWLQNSVLRFAALATADLEAADMSGADLMHAQLDQANLRSVNLSHAHLNHAHLAGATLSNARLSAARLRFTTLSAADCQAVDMSEADLMHARLDQANLSSANFENARLDYVDFAGAQLSKANLCGACLRHAKNLTPAQLEESTGSASTILPPHLQGTVPWSPAINPALERCDSRAPARVIPAAQTNSHTPRSIVLYDRQRWGQAAVLTAALVISALIWQRASKTSFFTMLDGQRKSEQSASMSSFPSPSVNKENSISERRGDSDLAATIETSSAEEELAKELDEATLPKEKEATNEPRAAPDRLAKEMELNAPDQNSPDKSNEASGSPLVLAETTPTAWPHAIVPNLAAEAGASSDLANARSSQKALALGVEPSPGLPARKPKIETAGTRSSAAMPPLPNRNPLR